MFERWLQLYRYSNWSDPLAFYWLETLLTASYVLAPRHFSLKDSTHNKKLFKKRVKGGKKNRLAVPAKGCCFQDESERGEDLEECRLGVLILQTLGDRFLRQWWPEEIVIHGHSEQLCRIKWKELGLVLWTSLTSLPFCSCRQPAKRGETICIEEPLLEKLKVLSSSSDHLDEIGKRI